MAAPGSAAERAGDGVGASFAALLDGVRAGSSVAQQTLYQRYRAQVAAIARRKLDRQPRSVRRQLDSEDLEQESWRSFFQAITEEGRYFAAEAALFGFLRTVTAHCCGMAFRRMNTLKRSRCREEPFALASAGVPDRRPGPLDQAAWAEKWERFLAGSPPEHRRILARLGGGEARLGIAAELGMSEKTVGRIVTTAERRWRRSEAT